MSPWGRVLVPPQGVYIISLRSLLKVRKGSGEEIPLVQGKEQWLSFAGAAVKRYRMSKVRETHVRW